MAVLSSPLLTLMAAEPAPLAIRFESTPGTTFRVVETVISTYENSPARSPLIRDRGGMFRHEYLAKITARTESGVSTVQIRGTRGNGAIWSYGDKLVLYDSADPKGQWAPADDDHDGKLLAGHAKHALQGRLSPRGEVVEFYAWWRKPPVFVPASEQGIADELHRIFLPVPPAPVRPGDVYRTKIALDDDPVNSGMFDNDDRIEVALRFEGLVDGLARFSVRGGIAHDPAGAEYARAVDRVTKWIDRIDVDGVMDVDPATGWVRAKDQTMRVTFRWFAAPPDREGGAKQMLRVVNRRRVIVTASRVE